MPTFAYFDQIEQKINTLLADKKYRDAFNLCTEFLIQYPNEKKLIKIKNKIEKASSAEIEKNIQEKLANLNPLWEEKKYSKILQILKELLKLAPDNAGLKKKYQKAEIAYKKQFKQLQEEFNSTQNARLTELLNNDPKQLIEELFILERENPGNQDVKTLVTDFRDQLIAKKIKEKGDLIDSEKYDIIENFIHELLQIDESNKRIQEFQQEIKAKKAGTEIAAAKEFVYAGEKHLDTLMKLKKYDKAIKVTKEILEVDKNNSYAKTTFKKAQKKYLKQLRKLVVSSIMNNLPALKNQYSENKSQFVKL